MTKHDFNLPVAILAGGLATRLRPLTETVPKSLLRVAGHPFLHHQLVSLRENGISEVVLCVGFLGEAIRSRFGDGRDYGLRIRYSFDGPELLGTGGAIRRALPMLGEAFFVLYGDSYLDIDYAAVAGAFLRSGASGLMTVFRNAGAWDASNVEFSAGRIIAYDKTRRTPAMRHIDYGLSVFSATAFGRHSGAGSFDLSQVQRGLVARGDMAAFEASQRFYEIGSHAGLVELERVLSTRSATAAAEEVAK
jgi:NDP-sugar pyrophosphorylase family protein